MLCKLDGDFHYRHASLGGYRGLGRTYTSYDVVSTHGHFRTHRDLIEDFLMFLYLFLLFLVIFIQFLDISGF